jgi:hypothetical protein
MFGLFRRREEAPIEIEADMDIGQPVETVYAMLDMASACNVMRERGHTVTTDREIAGRFYADDPGDASLGYVIDVEEAVSPRRYVIRMSFAGGRAVGVLLGDRSVYTLTPANALPDEPDDGGAQEEARNSGGCRVNLQSTFTVVPGLSRSKLRQHQAMLMVAVWNDLMRLKIHAEQGAEAAKRAEL